MDRPNKIFSSSCFRKLNHANYALIPLPIIPSFFKPPKISTNQSPGILEESKQFFHMANELLTKVQHAIDWLYNWKSHLFNFSIDFLGWIYDFLSNFVLQTPTWLFSNEWFIKISIIFSVISVFLTMILTVIEGIKKIMNQKHTDLKTIMCRLPIAMTVAGFSPLIFEKSINFLNKFSSTLVHAGKDQMTLKASLNTINFDSDSAISAIDAVSLLGIDIVLVALIIPVILQSGRRWFDLLSLGALTPVVGSCWCIDEYRGYHKQWWNAIKKLCLNQVYYAAFITIIGMIIMSVHATTSMTGLFVRLLVLLGGLYRLAYPPLIISSKLDHGDDVIDVFKKTKDAITLNPLKKIWRKGEIPESFFKRFKKK